jgi:oligopeptide transport system substrate-binding protein
MEDFMKRIVFIMLALLLCSVFIFANGGKEPAETKSNELIVAAQFFAGNAEGDMAELDPARRGTWSFHSLLWAPLVAGDTAGNYIPEKSLASSYDVSSDGTVYTFHLRDAKFSDGTPITAQQVVDCFGHWGMMLHGESKGYRDNFAMSKRLLPDIKGMLSFPDENEYDEFGIGKPIEGVKAPDSKTVQITLEGPSVTFLRRLMVAVSIFKPEDMIAAKDAEYSMLDYWPNHTAGAGPYKIAESEPGTSYTLVPNEYYFGPKPTIEKIKVLSVSTDMGTIMTAFENKELDIVATPITGDYARQAMSDPTLSAALVEMPTWQVSQLWTTPNRPLDDVNVRRAFTMAINREQLVKILNAGAPRPLYEVANMHRNPNVPDAVKETAKVKPLPFDPKKAMEELKKSDYYPEVLNMEINLYAPNSTDVPVMETVQKMLTDNLGLKNVVIRNEKIADMMNPPFKLHYWLNGQQPWFSDLIDTLKNMAWLIPDEPHDLDSVLPYISVPYVPELKELTEAAFLENDVAKRSEMIGRISQMWNDQAFSLDYAYPISYYLIQPYVKNTEWYKNAGQGKIENIEDVIIE